MIRDGRPWPEIDAAELTDEDLDDWELMEEVAESGVLDPASPNYNPGIAKRFNPVINNAIEPMREPMNSFINSVMATPKTKELMGRLTATVNSVMATPKMKELMGRLTATLQELRDSMRASIDASLPEDRPPIDDDTFDLLIYLHEEMEKAKKENPKLEKYDVRDVLLLGFNNNWNAVQGPFYGIIKKAEYRWSRDKANKEPGLKRLQRPAPLENITVPTDMLTRAFFSLAQPSDVKSDGDADIMTLTFGTHGKKKIELQCRFVHPSEAQLERIGRGKEFTGFDFGVAVVLDSTFSANGITDVSNTYILEEMGYGNKPSQDQLAKLDSSLIKGLITPVEINDSQVQKEWGYNSFHTGMQSVFPIAISREKYFANNYIGNTIITIQGHTIFHSLAEAIEQIRPWGKDILKQYKGTRSDRYWNTIFYLINQIAWLKNAKGKKRSDKIRFDPLYKINGDNRGPHAARNRRATREMVCELLRVVFVAGSYIEGFSLDVEEGKTDPQGVVIKFVKPKRIAGKK